ncbi:MAG: sodium:solute symporter family protein [Marinoscillum sp.]
MIFGLSYIDIAILVIYFGGIIYIGIKSSLSIQEEEDYFLGGRKFGKLFSTFASFGQATSADGPAGVATTTFNNGASGIWSSLLMLFATPLFWITAPWLRRLRMITMGDFYESRYGSRQMAATYALVGTIGMMGLLSVGYKAVSTTAMAMTPKPLSELSTSELQEKEKSDRLFALQSLDFDYLSGKEKTELETLRKQQPRALFSYLSEGTLVWSICIIVIIYTSLGGLEAAFYTDLLQGIFIILLSFILIPFAWSEINSIYGGGGMAQALDHLHQRLPESSFEIFGSPATIDFTWYFIITAALVSGLTVVTQPNQLVTAGAAKDEDSARIGFVTGTFMKRIVTIMWGVLGLAAILLFGGQLTNPDLVWGHATRTLLGPLNLGLVGLMLASLMAALMSTADCLMITVSGLIVNNLYRPLFPDKSAHHNIWAGRISGAIFLIGAAIVTTQFDNILQILKFIWEFFVIFVAAFWLGLKWRKANKKAAWVSIIATFSLFYLIPLLIPTFWPAVRTNEVLLKQTNPDPVLKTYTAKQLDVEVREEKIAQWEALVPEERSGVASPEPLSLGDEVDRTYVLPAKSIFWSKGLKTEDGQEYGSGYIYLELLLFDRLGFDLSQNPYALNETIRLLIRLVFPFLLMFGVAFITKRDDPKLLDDFYTNMRKRVRPSGAKGSAQPEALVFPGSDWEFYKWNKQDWIGFLLSWVMVVLIIGLLYFVVSIGG